MRSLVTGATGLVGRALAARLEGKVAALSRDPARARALFPTAEAHAWAPEAGPPPAAALEGVEVVFHLAGEPVGEGRWTTERKRRIRASRELGTRHLVAGFEALERRPSVLVVASAVGYYGDRGDETLDEGSGPGRGFLSEVCEAWEREALEAERLGVRVVCVRLGIVLAPGGGALARMLPAFRRGLGGRLGSGRQWMAWIHIEDAVGLCLHAAGDARIHGPLNAVSPAPTTNAEFTRALGRALHRPAFLPVPRAALRLAFGELGQILTHSQRVRPGVAERTGYVFRHPGLEGALAAALRAV
jgi:hypothetical protein